MFMLKTWEQEKNKNDEAASRAAADKSELTFIFSKKKGSEPYNPDPLKNQRYINYFNSRSLARPDFAVLASTFLS